MSREDCRRLNNEADTWYDPHNYDSDDSDMTVNYGVKYPDEDDNSWFPRHINSPSVTTAPNNLNAPK